MGIWRDDLRTKTYSPKKEHMHDSDFFHVSIMILKTTRHAKELKNRIRGYRTNSELLRRIQSVLSLFRNLY